jgi:hypothetical protein
VSRPALLILDISWSAIEAALALVAESESERPEADDLIRLRGLELIEDSDGRPALTPAGERYWKAKFVLEDAVMARDALAEALRDHPVVTGFCGALWGAGQRPVTGALRLIRQLTKSSNDIENRRWLALMNSAGLIVYNPKFPTLRLNYNPNELVPAEVSEERGKTSAHVLSPDRPFGNLLALRSVLRAATDFLWWYEPQMPPKVLEVLYGELDGAKVTDVRLLSGPANITDALKADFGRFSTELKKTRGIVVGWRVLQKPEAFKRHDRIILSKDQAKNLPPLNTILAGSVGEILPSEIAPGEFEEWWKLGTDLAAFVVLSVTDVESGRGASSRA